MEPKDLIRRWAASAELFVLEAIRPTRSEVLPDGITTQQREALRLLTKFVLAKLKRADGVPLTEEEAMLAAKDGLSIMSGHGTGKDAFVSWLILWILTCFYQPLIPCTAPTQHQLRDVLWAEIHKWMQHSKLAHQRDGTGFNIEDWITWQADRVFMTESKGRNWMAVPRTCNPKGSAEEQAGTLQGFHADVMMVVLDEASEIPDPVVRPLEAAMTGKLNFQVLVFNPTQSTGFAVESQKSLRHRYIALRWNAEESEIVTRESTERIASKYGKDSNAYRIRVLGLPPLAAPDALIPWDWAMRAVDAEVEPLEDDPVIMSIDPSRGLSDPACIMVMRGPKILQVLELHSIDTEVLTGWAQAAIFEWEPLAVMVDVIGVGGGIADKLRHRMGNVLLVDVNVSETESLEDKRQFHKLRDELFWRVRVMFEKGEISIPKQFADQLIAELTAIKFSPDDGKVKVESKKQMRTRGMDSPNQADCLMMLQYFRRDYLRRMAQRPRFAPRRRGEGGDRISWRTL